MTGLSGSFGLSGVTPGERKDVRYSSHELWCALTHGCSRRVRLVGAFPSSSVMPDSSLIEALARALLAGEPAPNLLLDRCRRTLGRRWRWLRPLTQRYLTTFGTEAWPRHREVVRFLRQDVGFRRACRKHSDELVVAEWLLPPQQMFAGKRRRVWKVPAVESVGDLASGWG